jgi:hypothetical protein
MQTTWLPRTSIRQHQSHSPSPLRSLHYTSQLRENLLPMPKDSWTPYCCCLCCWRLSLESAGSPSFVVSPPWGYEQEEEEEDKEKKKGDRVLVVRWRTPKLHIKRVILQQKRSWKTFQNLWGTANKTPSFRNSFETEKPCTNSFLPLSPHVSRRGSWCLRLLSLSRAHLGCGCCVFLHPFQESLSIIHPLFIYSDVGWILFFLNLRWWKI